MTLGNAAPFMVQGLLLEKSESPTSSLMRVQQEVLKRMMKN